MKNPIVIKTHKAWQKYKKWQAKNINKIRQGQEITNLGEFSEIYRESGTNLKAIKDAVRYQMSTHTWKTIDQRVFEMTGKHISTQKRGMSTREAAALISDQIKAFIKQSREDEQKAIAAGEIKRVKTSKEEALSVAEYFFGS